MPDHLTMQKSYLASVASSLMQRLLWFKTRNAIATIQKIFLTVDLGRSRRLHHTRSSPQLYHHNANARPVRELWQTSAKTKPWRRPLKYFLTGWHPKVQRHWRCLKNCYDPTGDKTTTTTKNLLNLENRRTLVCEVWPTGSAWVTWQETKRGQRWAFRREKPMTTSCETWPMCGQRILSSECSKICSGKHPDA